MELDNNHAINLRNNIGEIALILRALGHESRLQAVSYLVDGEIDLKYLIDETGMSKNGLVNHLSRLIDAGIVVRVSRGKYKLTKDGTVYVRDIVDQYLVSEKYRSRRRKIDTSMYQWRSHKLSEKIISNPAEYKPCWFSYQGAVLGVLNSFGVKVSLAEVIAVTGYGWITNAMKKNLCPSAPSAFHDEVWNGIYKATENLGYNVDLIISGAFEWDEKQKPTLEAEVNAKKQYDEVTKEIDADRPVVMWGIPIPEYGIVNGYKGEEYIVSTFRRLINHPDDPIHYTGLMAPGGLMSMRFIEPKELEVKKVLIETLRLGHKLGTGDVPQIPEYVLGPDAYDVLINNLTEETFDENSQHGTAYTMACLMEAKWGVSEYLKKVDPVIEEDLIPISEKYIELNHILTKCHEIFPMGPGEMLEKKCNTVAELLMNAKKIEVEALKELGKALESL